MENSIEELLQVYNATKEEWVKYLNHEAVESLERISETAQTIMGDLGQSIGLNICDLPFSRTVHHALDQTWTRDPFDRIIVGQAAAREASLITKDRVIHEHYSGAVW